MRLGLHQIGGLGSEMGERIAAARPFKDVADLARRAELSRDALDRLAAAGALASLSGHRREAAWAVAAVPIQRDLLLEVPAIEISAELSAPSEGENLVTDFSTLGLTLGRHPLSLLRANLERRRYVSTLSLRDYEHNRPARCAGNVRAQPAVSSS